MTFARIFPSFWRILRSLAYKAYYHSRLGWTCLANRYGRSPITHPGGPVVSLTTYGNRIQSVHLAIESIGRGQMLPSRIILWLDGASLVDTLPIGIRRLKKRGLEIKFCNDYGPYKKFYPYVESLSEFRDPLVTADDDVLYPSYWLMKLAEAFRQFPHVINCHRARVMGVSQVGIAKYEGWKMAGSTMPSYCHCATGVGGVIYPPLFQQELKKQGTAFLTCCPKGDDIWLHVQALRAGYKVRQVSKKSFRLLEIPRTQEIALQDCNVTRGGNDRQIANTYRASDIDRLRENDRAESLVHFHS
jgi:hypothetical protein